MKDKNLITHYLPLIAILLAAFAGVYLFRYDRALRVSLAIASGFSYFVWGLIHHYIHKDLNIEIIFEYLFICIFGVVAIISLID